MGLFDDFEDFESDLPCLEELVVLFGSLAEILEDENECLLELLTLPVWCEVEVKVWFLE